MAMLLLTLGIIFSGAKFLSFSAPGSETRAADAEITIFIAGDSTACNYIPSRVPRTGWGQVFGQFFTEPVSIANEAISGRSSLSFITEGALDKILDRIGPGDYLFIQFGHNDEKKEDPTRHTEPFTSYQTNLAKYVTGARSKGAYPVLLTPIQRLKFGAGGELIPTHGDYPRAMRELAVAEKVPLIDLTERTTVLLEQLGPGRATKLFMNLEPGESPNYPAGSKDDTHLTLAGALEVARLVTEEVRRLQLPIARYLK